MRGVLCAAVLLLAAGCRPSLPLSVRLLREAPSRGGIFRWWEVSVQNPNPFPVRAQLECREGANILPSDEGYHRVDAEGETVVTVMSDSCFVLNWWRLGR